MEESKEYVILPSTEEISPEMVKKETEEELEYVVEWIFKDYVNQLRKDNINRKYYDQYWNIFALPNGSMWNLEDVCEKLKSGRYKIKIEIREDN